MEWGSKIFKGLTMQSWQKQTWRLLHNKNSLFYWIFKVKIFPNCTIMEVTNLSSASYAWKSILRGREVIKRGVVWWIGDGRSSAIWGGVLASSETLSQNFITIYRRSSRCQGECFNWPRAQNLEEEVIDANLLSFEAAMFKKKIHYTTWIRPIHSLGHSTTWGNT